MQQRQGRSGKGDKIACPRVALNNGKGNEQCKVKQNDGDVMSVFCGTCCVVSVKADSGAICMYSANRSASLNPAQELLQI